MSILALDLGRRRVGVAISHGIAASTLKPLFFDERSPGAFYRELEEIIELQKVEKIVIGLPLGRLGKETAQGRWTRERAREISVRLHLPVSFAEESFSSFQAKENLKRVKPKKLARRHAILDSESAKVILEQYLHESRRSSL